MRGESVSQERGSQPIHEVSWVEGRQRGGAPTKRFGEGETLNYSSTPAPGPLLPSPILRTKTRRAFLLSGVAWWGGSEVSAHPRTPEVVQLPAAPTSRRMSPVRIIRTLPGATCVLDPCRSKVLFHFLRALHFTLEP
ncbi:hypothetical protein CEXT_701601 [Caerostris extrusa]|uniref:Uncharacterized protein n=1 Tax=Caerostris extrusa TaxID=172846 RepID=A0AAV4WY45_CAEEX|nr:hypothetical protein CEXT_701601 [Caerostris extrusa]